MRHRLLLPLSCLLFACAEPGPSTNAEPSTAAQPDPSDDPEADLRARLDAMLEANPKHGGVLYVFARFAVGEGHEDEALAWLERLAAIESWDYALEAADFGALAQDPRFIALAEQLEARAPKLDHGPVAMELDRVDLLPEGVSWDPKRRELLVGSMAERAVYAADADGRMRVVVAPRQAGLLGVLGMDVDVARDHVWVVGVGAPFVPQLEADEAGLGGVWGFSLADGSSIGKAIGQHPGLNDLVVLDDGRVVVTNTQTGSLLVRAPGSDTLEPLVPDDSFFAPNGIARGAEPGVVHVADFQGIHRVGADGEITLLEPPAGVATLGGIDGLARSGDTLVGIQNVFGPGRVWALSLDGEGRALLGARILDDAHPRLRGPTTGVFVDDSRFWYMGNASLQFGPEGMTEAGPDDRHVILEVSL